MGERIIQAADLSGIYTNLRNISIEVQNVQSGLGTVNNNVAITASKLDQLTNEFHRYVAEQGRANRLNQAETRLVQIRQEIKQKFGHYDSVRRTAIGILQADDLALVKKDIISAKSEGLMISTPNYWLAPCLLALSDWINDKKTLAEQAVKEAIRRDDEKTSLFFALVCRRAGRLSASLKWIDRYLSNQDEENLDRKTMIVLDAYAGGLFGVDAEGLIARQLEKWMDHLSSKPGFVEEQQKQWTEAILIKRKQIDESKYPYLTKYSHTWPQLADVMSGAYLHGEIRDYFENIFDKKVSNEPLKAQLDDILDSLVTEYDDEELPFRKREKLEQLIIDNAGDEIAAQRMMDVEQNAFTTHKDFTQLLTEAAMNPEVSHASYNTQKFAISLSKDWILSAYNDIIATNRAKVPHEIEINVDTFNDKTVDGSEETDIITKFTTQMTQEKENVLATLTMSTFDQMSDKAGIAIACIGIALAMTDSIFLGTIAIIAGVLLYLHKKSKQNNIEQARKKVENQYTEKQEKGEAIIRAMLAEVVDFRAEFTKQDNESVEVIDFLSNLSSSQYVKKLSNGQRRVQV